MDQQHARVRIDPLLQPGHPACEEKHHRVVVVLPTGSATVEHVADRVDGDDVRRLATELRTDGLDQLLQPFLIKDEVQLGRHHQIAPGEPERLFGQTDGFHPLLEVRVLHLGLEVKNLQRACRHHFQERQACCHVRQPRQQEVALAHLGRPAKDRDATGRDDPARHQVYRQRCVVVEHLAHRESRQDSRAGLHRDALATLDECLAVEPLVDGIGRIPLIRLAFGRDDDHH